MPDLSTYAAVKDWLYGLKNTGAKYGIERMRVFSDALGHPEQRFPLIHVAGTNGKGSACAMLEAIFRHHGRRTGLFTSPHLVHQGERIQVDRRILGHDEIVGYTRRLSAVAAEIARHDPDLHPTFFEFMTGMAFLKFAESAVDIGIIETGLGGRLDSTNVVNPEVSVITSISLDHTEILGDSVEVIAREKAGILKPGKPVVLGELCPAAEAVIREIAAERGCAVHSIREAFGDDPARYPETSLAGEFQRRNAAVAMLAARLLADRHGLTEAGAKEALRAVRWAGRWDRYALHDRTLILDATHNPEGAIQLERNLRRLVEETGRRPVVAAGVLGERRARGLFPVVAEFAREIVLVRPRQARASAFEEMEAAIPPGFAGPVRRSAVRGIFPAVGECAAGGPGDTIVATGSIYLIGEIMEAVFHEIPVAEHVLQD
ncbi:MAG: bifunctional folylpolyglutamate synthase/dihydrofolate synthase [Opitutales bacterium]|nr:bifunctional folylpolyglutamate synthase/dihydrofolate synthase [Opitutales bacterium]